MNSRPLASALLQKWCRIHLNTSHSSPKSCYDFDQSRHDCLWTTVVTSPFQVNLVRKLLNRVTISQIVSRFSISRINLSANPIVSRCPESWHDFRVFQNSQFEANIQHISRKWNGGKKFYWILFWNHFNLCACKVFLSKIKDYSSIMYVVYILPFEGLRFLNKWVILCIKLIRSNFNYMLKRLNFEMAVSIVT